MTAQSSLIVPMLILDDLPLEALRARLYALKYGFNDDQVSPNFPKRISALNLLQSEVFSQISPTAEYGDPIEIIQAKILGIQWLALLSSYALQNRGLSPERYQNLITCLLVMAEDIDCNYPISHNSPKETNKDKFWYL